MTYIVRRGDTLYGIARLLQVTVNELMGWNGMSGGSHRQAQPGRPWSPCFKLENRP